MAIVVEISINDETGVVTILSGREAVKAALSFCNKIKVETPNGEYELWMKDNSLFGKSIEVEG